ncbi:MAG: cytochrome c peroxidase [Roseobacter sp.]
MKLFSNAICFTWLATVSIGQTLPAPVSDADFFAVNLEEAQLGQLLFYDPILSGNKTVACATCHHPKFATSDGVSLSIGDGGIGLGPARQIDVKNQPEKRIPRNSPALFNLGAREFTVMFHDGRLEADPRFRGALRSPLDADMMQGFASVLSAQTMFPVLSRDEMAGSYNENDIGRAVRQGLINGAGGAWDLLSRRVGALPEYQRRFAEVYPNVRDGAPIAFTDISNAIAAFIAHEWRSDNAPFDALLRGEDVFDPQEKQGLALFYGSAGCATCHAGPFLSDHKFHAMGTVQIGPGKAANFETSQRDEGRFRVTGNHQDLYAFRTPSLRNIEMTGPYGHAGAHKDLDHFVAAHADPVTHLNSYDRSQAILFDPQAKDFALMASADDRQALAQAVSAPTVPLDQPDIDAIVAFLKTLTDTASIKGRMGIPEAVPSGLPIP